MKRVGRTALTAEQREVAKQRIAAATLAIYHEGGLKAITMRAIASRLGVAPSWLYLYYRNRMDLIDAMWRDTAGEMRAGFYAAAEAHADPIARLRSVLTYYVDFALANPDMFKAAFLTVLREDQLPDPLPPSAMIPFHALLRDAIAEAQQGRRATVDPDLGAQVIWASIHGCIAIVRNLPRFRFAPPEQLAAKALDLIIEGLGLSPSKVDAEAGAEPTFRVDRNPVQSLRR